MFGIEFPDEGTAPKSGNGGSQGGEGRGTCAATLTACNTSRATRNEDDEVGTIEGDSRLESRKGRGDVRVRAYHRELKYSRTRDPVKIPVTGIS